MKRYGGTGFQPVLRNFSEQAPDRGRRPVVATRLPGGWWNMVAGGRREL